MVVSNKQLNVISLENNDDVTLYGSKQIEHQKGAVDSMNEQNSLLQLLNVNNGEDIVFLIGAGCSISSGCMAAKKLTYEFKKRIYCIDKSIRMNESQSLDETRLREEIDNYFDDTSIKNPYSYYFEKCFPDCMDRNSFIRQQFQGKKPSLGFLCFANYIIEKRVKYVLTTNFDLLLESALHKIDETFDFATISENQIPIINSSFNLVKLHGDYKYDAIRNTGKEVEDIELGLKEKLLSIHSTKIIVLGYSGADNSIMKFLKEYLNTHHNTQLIWCGIEETLRNSAVQELLNNGRNSYYQTIGGFDSVFENYYSTFGKQSQVIEELSSDIRHSGFSLNISNQPEHFATNSYEITILPSVFKIATNEIVERKLSNIDGLFNLRFRSNFYIVPSSDNISNPILSQSDRVSLSEEELPLRIKCKLIKEYIKSAVLSNDVSVYHDNVFPKNDGLIKQGLLVNVDLVDSKICLILNINYFVASDEIDEKTKYEINKKKSELYTKQNYDALLKLIGQTLPNNGIFNFAGSQLKIDMHPITSNGLQEFYECRKEPIMIGNNMESTNQLKILNTNGPKKVLFSKDLVKVGVFCCEEDKPILRSFVDKLIDGDDGNGRGIVQKFLGFEKVFGKKIAFLFDALPPFSYKALFSHKMSEVIDFYQRGLHKMFNERQVDLGLIYFSNQMADLKERNGIDFHSAIKLSSANKYKTQFLEEKTIKSNDNKSKILYNLSTAIYTKTIGMPWYPKRYQKDTLFLGMSFGCDSNGITVGCSQMFDGAGRGMQLIISQVSDKKRRNQYLSKEEAFQLGKKIRQTYYRTSKIDELKRIVIHRNDPFVKEEIEGFKMAFQGIDDFDLIQLIEGTRFNVYPFIGDTRCGFYPIKRGTIVKASKDVAYVWTDGSVNDSDVMPNATYRNNTRGMSSPLKIVKHYGNISLNDAMDDLLMLSKMDFNSADVLYSKLPVTIKYSRMVCDLIKQDNFEDDLISFEYIM